MASKLGKLLQSVGTPTREAFARLVADALAREGHQGPFELSPDAFSLSLGGAGELSLAAPYARYCEAPRRQRKKLLKEIAQAAPSVADLQAELRAALEDFEAASDHLTPIVRPASFFYPSLVEREVHGRADAELVHRPLGAELAVGAALALPRALAPVSCGHARGWGQPITDLMERAEGNLWRASQEPFEEIATGLWASPWRDGRDAARLSLPALFWRLELRGAPVVMAPTQNALLVAGSDDSQGLESLALMAQQVLAEALPLSGVALIAEHDPPVHRLRPWLPAPSHPAYALLKRLELTTMASAYDAQGDLLRPLMGHTTFVSAYKASEGEGEQPPFSFCVWPDLPALLPVADRVFLHSSRSSEVVKAPWSAVRRHARDLMKPVPVHPARFQVQALPSEATIAAIAAEPGATVETSPAQG